MKSEQIIVKVFLIGFLLCVTQTAFAQITWDGGGATNNWSEAANWSTDTVPLNTDVVIFDGTSTKDVTFDIALTRTAATSINTGYTGTLSADSPNLTFNGAFTQSSGTFNGGSGTLDFNGNFTLSGGTFTQSSNLNQFSSFNFSLDSAAVYNHNNGTFVIDGSFNFIGTATSLELFNLRVAAIHNFGSKTIIANETLELISGNVIGGTIESRNNLIFAANYTSTTNVRIAGNNTRTITLPITANMPRLTINAPNVTVQPSSTSGTLTFTNAVFNLQSGTFNANGANLVFNSTFTQSGGTFNGGSGNLTFNSGGTLTLTGGIFNATSGTLTYNPFGSNITTDATFNPNGGTFIVNEPTNFNGNAASMNFHNLTTLANFGMGNRIFNIAGTLNLASSSGGNGTIQAAGDVVIGSGFTGGGGLIQFVGTGNQTYTNNGGVNPAGIWTLNKTGGTVNLASNLDLSNAATNFVLTNGTITTGANTVIAGTRNITRTNGFINGNLRRTFSAAGSRTFDVGTINGYAPVTVNATAGTFGASTTFTVGGNNGSLGGSSPTQSLTRNWTLEPSVGGITSADIRFDYLQTDVPSGANESTFSFLRNNGIITDSFTPTSIDTTNNFATLNGVTSFSAWSLGNLAPLASNSTISGRVLTDSGRGISKARLTLTDSNGNSRIVLTNPFGYYRFDEVESGENYVVSVFHKRYEFPNPSQVVFVTENLSDLNFTAINQASSNSKLEISGRVIDAKGVALANISIELTRGNFKKKLTVRTDNEGFYSFDDLSVGETYFINIISEKHNFSNPSRVFTLTEDLTNTDFVSDSK
ncbi:MAG: carboxypeptidase-like regulatory domain-containing protein [Pyrinomonadaceae bacterium]|nr:carboxypeptidase-like regulatory domain-containing protein [Pyrinomonadaceae bacterium]